MNFRLLTREEMEQVPGIQQPIPASMFVIGAVDEKGLAAACGIFLVAHGDPIWIRPDLRNGGKLLLHLWEATKEEIQTRRFADELLVGMTDTNPGQPTEDLVARMCRYAGGDEVKGRFFVVPIRES